jgi:hypothetical protein
MGVRFTPGPPTCWGAADREAGTEAATGQRDIRPPRTADLEWRVEAGARAANGLAGAERTPPDMEVVLKGMNREFHGPTIDELYAETIVRRQGRGGQVLGVR